MVSNVYLGDKIVEFVRDFLRDRFVNHDTSFRVSIYQSREAWEDIVSIYFHDKQGRENHVEEKWLSGHMHHYNYRVKDETIATIMLLLG